MNDTSSRTELLLHLHRATHDLECVKGALASQQELNVRLEQTIADLTQERDGQRREKNDWITEYEKSRAEIADLEASRKLANEGAARLADANNQLRAELDAQKSAGKTLDEILVKAVNAATNAEYERDAWRSCAEKLALELDWRFGQDSWRNPHCATGVALAEFERLKGKP